MLGGKSFRLLVDTGAPFTVLDAEIVRAATHFQQQALAYGGSIIGRESSRSYLVDASMEIGGFSVKNVEMLSQAGIKGALNSAKAEAASSSGGTPIIGLLGGDFLAANDAIIDIGNKTLYLKHSSGSAVTKPH